MLKTLVLCLFVSIASCFGQTSTVLSFDTVAALNAFTVPSQTTRLTAIVKGNLANSDYGGGTYIYRSGAWFKIGLVPPPVTQAQRLALTPTAGMLVNQTDGTPSIYGYQNGAWVALGGSGSSDNWVASGTTNSTLSGTARANSAVFTNFLSLLNGTASRVVVLDASKNATNVATTGIIKGDGTAATSGTDYAPATSGSSILKGNGAGAFANAASGTDYAPATSGSSILKGNGAGGFSNAASGTDYAPATSGSVPLKGNGSGGTATASSADLQTALGQVYQGTNTVLTTLAGIGAGTSGDILYRNASQWTNLPIGTEGQRLVSVGGFPAWVPQIKLWTEGSIVQVVNTNVETVIYTNNTAFPNTIFGTNGIVQVFMDGFMSNSVGTVATSFKVYFGSSTATFTANCGSPTTSSTGVRRITLDYRIQETGANSQYHGYRTTVGGSVTLGGAVLADFGSFSGEQVTTLGTSTNIPIGITITFGTADPNVYFQKRNIYALAFPY